jgi:hypothetical protein
LETALANGEAREVDQIRRRVASERARLEEEREDEKERVRRKKR